MIRRRGTSSSSMRVLKKDAVAATSAEQQVLLEPAADGASAGTVNNTTVQQLRVASLNCFLRPPGIQSYGSDFKDLRVPLIADALARHDIVCLQELFRLGTQRGSVMDHLMAKNGLKYKVALPGPGFWTTAIIDGGVTLFSRFPIVDAAYRVLPIGRQSDATTGKGIVWGLIQVQESPARYLHVATTHIQASYAADTASELTSYHWNLEHQRIRCSQLRVIREFLAEKMQRGYSFTPTSSNPPLTQRFPMLLMGDFNVEGRAGAKDGESSETYKFLMTLLQHECWSVRDVIAEQHDGKHDITDCSERMDAQPVTADWRACEGAVGGSCYDYMFLLVPTDAEKLCCLKPIPGTAKAWDPPVPASSPVRHVSDHYALSCAFSVT